jgi:hypothetical protein
MLDTNEKGQKGRMSDLEFFTLNEDTGREAIFLAD